MEQVERIEGAVSSEMETLRRERDRFVALAFCAADLLLEVDSGGNITYAAGATQSLLGCTPEDLTGTSFRDLVAQVDRALMDELLRGMSPGCRLDPVALRLSCDRGITQPLSLTGYHLPDLPGNFFFALRLGATSVSPELASELHHDADTGLLEKASFAKLATERLHEAAGRGEELKLTMLRTPQLSAFRSRLDREASESLSRTLGACLQAGSVAGGTAGKLNDASYGLIHKPMLDVKEITARFEGLIKAADPRGIGVPVEAGTVDASLENMSEEDSMRVLLFTINQFCASEGEVTDINDLSQTLAEMSRETSRKLSYFRHVTENETFDIAFQPIVFMETGEIHHFEALARFGHNLEQSPYSLVTFAENTGLICDFDLAMCRKLLNWLSNSNKAGNRHVVAANLSGRSLGNASFVAALHELLKKHQSLRSQIMFEITESAQISDIEMVNHFIQGLRNAGHQVCLDDFGAGAAALKYLHSLEVDVVKIDGQYVRSAMEKKRFRAFLKAIAGLCRDLSVETVAEMVEDARCVEMLKTCGVEFAQGYMFGKPSFDIDSFKQPGQSGKDTKRKSGASVWRPAYSSLQQS